MAVDIDVYLDSLSPPEITINGKTFKGRLLSLPEWLPFEKQFANLGEGDALAQFKVLQNLIQSFCDLAFPSPFWQLFNFRYKTVAQQILALPPSAMIKVMRDFFASQARGIDIRRVLAGDEISVDHSQQSS